MLKFLILLFVQCLEGGLNIQVMVLVDLAVWAVLGNFLEAGTVVVC